MLVLTRQENECIHIGDDIVVTVVSIEGTKVRLGIAAPREVPIMRPEAKVRTPRGRDDGRRHAR